MRVNGLSSTLMTDLPLAPAPSTGSALLEAAQHVRTLVEDLLQLDVETPIAGELTELLGAAVALVAPHLPTSASRLPINDQTWAVHIDRSPVSGRLNPMSPPVHLTRAEDGSLLATLSLGLAYQGPPGRVHGGWVATLLDHAMGAAAHTFGAGLSVTRTLTIDYDDSTPLFEEFTVTGRVESVEGRKIWMVGEITCGGTVRARARGLWIVIVPPAAGSA